MNGNSENNSQSPYRTRDLGKKSQRKKKRDVCSPRSKTGAKEGGKSKEKGSEKERKGGK